MLPLKAIKEINMILVSSRGTSERVNVEKVFTVYLKILIRMILNCQVLFGIDINWFRLLGSPSATDATYKFPFCYWCYL